MNRLEIITEQEQRLQFEKFSYEEAWELGKSMVEKAKRKGVAMNLSIALCNDFVLFQYASAGTSKLNQIWLEMKYNTVKVFGRSTLGSTLEARVIGQDLKDHGLEKDCRLCAGGFPIRLKDGCMIGIISASGIPGIGDHNFIVECLSDYLGVTDLPVLEDFNPFDAAI